MAAPIGNQFWKLAPKTGRKLLYETPELLMADCMEYFEQTAARTDWNKQQFVGKDGRAEEIKVHPPFTKTGLCVFLGCTMETLNGYKPRSKEFLSVLTRVEEIIYNQKYEGAATGHYQQNIIARDLGLVDKKEMSGAQTMKIEAAKGVDLGKLLGDE